MNRLPSHSPNRRGSVYLAVLGTALVASVLAMSALALQRIQNRQLTLAVDVRQAQLNAEAAIELGRWTIQQDEDWRQTYANVDGPWFTRDTGAGTLSLEVIDPVDGDLSDDAEEAVVLRGIGMSGDAEQRVEIYVDPRPQPAAALKAAADVGGAAAGQSATDWNAVVAAYQAAGTEININSLPTTTPNLGRNVGIEIDAAHWTGAPGTIPSADITRVSTYRNSGSYSLRVDNRSAYYSGAAQSVDQLVEAGDYLYVEAWVYHRYSSPVSFIWTLYTNGSDSSVSNSAGSAVTVNPYTWTAVTATMEARSWSGSLEYAFVKIGGVNSQSGNTTDFWIDDLVIREAVTGSTRFIYHRALGPGVNPFGTANSEGVYWLNCGGNKVVIERSRILGTLLLLNPGSGSQISNGPVHFAPAKPGYPSLVVHGNFLIRATTRALNEVENCASTYVGGTNFNPLGIPYEFNNALCNSTDNAANDIYPSEINGLVAVSGNLTFENQPRIRGQVIAGGSITGAPSLDHQLDAVYNPPPGFAAAPNYEPRPASARKAVVP